jgi:hypothetical protein
LWVLLTLALAKIEVPVSGQSLTVGDPTYSHCQDITIPMCLELPYAKTVYPNLMGHANQDEASDEIYQYFPLIKVNCSPDIQVDLGCFQIFILRKSCPESSFEIGLSS